jgi:hypothetical protein
MSQTESCEVAKLAGSSQKILISDQWNPNIEIIHFQHSPPQSICLWTPILKKIKLLGGPLFGHFVSSLIDSKIFLNGPIETLKF